MFKFLRKLFMKIFNRKKYKELKKLVEVEKWQESNPSTETYQNYRDIVRYGFKK